MLPWDDGPAAPWNDTGSGPGGYLHVDDVIGLEHTYGCGVAINAPGAAVPIRTLQNLARNPNFGGEVMIVGLGCEKTNLTAVEEFLHRHGFDLGKPVVRFGIQELGGTQAVIDRGLEEIAGMLPQVNEIKKKYTALFGN